MVAVAALAEEVGADAERVVFLGMVILVYVVLADLIIRPLGPTR